MPKYKPINLVTLIHSAPENVDLRNTIRKTWGEDLKRVFVLGKHSDWNKKLNPFPFLGLFDKEQRKDAVVIDVERRNNIFSWLKGK